MMKTRPQFIRANAMRIANQLATFNPQSDVTNSQHNKEYVARPRFLPDVKKWPFIDLDPLLGSIDEILIDDGARATWPIDFATAFPWEDGFRLAYARSLSTAEARQLGCRLFSSKMLRAEKIDYVHGIFDWGIGVYSLLGGKWINATAGTLLPRGIKQDSPLANAGYGNIMAGAALRHRYEWSAIFDFPNGISLRFGTTAAGVLEIFRDRDRGLGEVRRSALLHWVRRHWRRGQASSRVVYEIRKHLRGQEKLSWHGMDVLVTPSEFEVEQAA